MREAGALAASTFQTALKSWSKHGGSPVSEADIAVDNFLRERLMRARAGLRLALGRERGRSRAHACAAAVGGRSDRRHARLSGGPTDWSISVALVDERPPGDRRDLRADAGCALRCLPRGWHHAQRRADRGQRRRGFCREDRRRSQTDARTTCQGRADASHGAEGVFAGAAHRAGRGGHARYRLCVTRQSRLGPCGGRSFGARSRRRIDHVRGAALIYNRAEPMHGALVAAGRTRHEAFLALVRSKTLAFA